MRLAIFLKSETLNDLRFGSETVKVITEPESNPAKVFKNCYCSLIVFSEVK